MRKKRNELLNIMEAIAAILVVFIHFKFPGQAGDAVMALARISVPFFFSISGYFFFRNDAGKELSSILGKIKRLLMLILCSECVYFLFHWMLQIDNHGFTAQALKNVFVLEIWKPYCAELANRLAVFAPPLNGTFWFVGSLIVVYICVYLVVKYSQQRASFVVSLVLLLIGFALRRILFYTGVRTQFPYERLLPFLPFPFFMIGYYIRKHQSRFDEISDKVYGAVFAAGVLFTLLEQGAVAHTLYAGTLILVPAMISFGGKHRVYAPKTAVGRYLSHVGADTATYIYMLHTMIAWVCAVIIPRLLPIDPQQPLYLWIFPVVACAASIVCGEAIYLLKQILFKKR